MIKILIEPQRVLDIAFADAEYIPPQFVTPSVILTAQQRYLRPVIGEALIKALSEGEYVTLYEDYVAPALAEHVRFLLSTPLDPQRRMIQRRAKSMMRRLSEHLDENAAEYAEYNKSRNILKKCTIHGGIIQIH